MSTLRICKERVIGRACPFGLGEPAWTLGIPSGNPERNVLKCTAYNPLFTTVPMLETVTNSMSTAAIPSTDVRLEGLICAFRLVIQHVVVPTLFSLVYFGIVQAVFWSMTPEFDMSGMPAPAFLFMFLCLWAAATESSDLLLVSLRNSSRFGSTWLFSGWSDEALNADML